MRIEKKNIIILLALFFINNYNSQVYAQKQNATSIIENLESRAKKLQFSNPDSACILYKEISQFYETAKKNNDYYATQINLATCYSIQQKNEEALKLFQSCVAYFEQKKDSFRLHSIYSGIASICFNIDDYKKTIYYLEMASKICNFKKYPSLKFNTLLNLANCFMRTTQYDSAFNCYNDASKILPLFKDPIFAFQLKLKYATLYYEKEQYELSINYGLKVLEYPNTFDKRIKMSAYTIVGLCYYEQKKYFKSDLYFDSAMVISKAINSLNSYCEILQNKFRIDTATHNKDNAINHLLELLVSQDSIFEMNKSSLTNELLIRFQTEKKESENKILEKENAKRLGIIKWQQVLNYIVIILSFIIIAILFLYLRYRNKQQKRAIEQEMNVAELKALKAQLNPHLIQNIFQIISNQVKINPSEVSVFLQRTAEYFRSVLNGTDITDQSLEDEIIFTEKYVQFQQSLFDNKLTYSINIDDNVDTFDTKVPAMLFQPFIENSIKYGLQLNQEPMHIDITCKNENNVLSISIVDNGNFMVNDTIINDKSFGNAIVEKRLLLYYKNYSNKPMLTTKKMENGKGFVVNITLPLLH